MTVMFGSRRPHQAIGLIALGAYIIAAFGFLPAPSMVRNLLGIHGGDRFPCESHACGCFDPQTCMTDCCCYSPNEVRAWAESNNLDPMVWAQAETAPAEEPMPDDCPLCALGDAEPQPVSDEAGSRAGIELPSVSPLGCKQIGQWLLLVPPIATRPIATAPRVIAHPRAVALRPTHSRTPTGESVEIPDPPPRAA